MFTCSLYTFPPSSPKLHPPHYKLIPLRPHKHLKPHSLSNKPSSHLSNKTRSQTFVQWVPFLCYLFIFRGPVIFSTINHDSINARSPEVRVPMFSSPIYSIRKCLERMAHHSTMAPQYLHQLLLFGARETCMRHVNCTLHLLQCTVMCGPIYLWSQRHPQQHQSTSTRPNVNVVVVSIFSVLNFPSFEADAFRQQQKHPKL